MRNDKGQFTSQNKPWNKDKKGIHLSPETEFKPGEKFGNTHPSWKGGVHMISNDCAYLWSGINKRVRRPRVVWENTHGKIPDGHVIIHKDGDKYNDDISNLECISRADNLKRNSGRL
jgi:hypothetical protein